VSRRLTYTFGPLERRGLAGGVRAGQIVAVGVATVVAIVAVDTSPSATGLAVAVLALAIALVVAVFPVADRTISDWLPVIGSFALRPARRRRAFRSAVPLAGRVARRTHNASVEIGDAPPDAPPSLRGVRIVDASYRERSIGALSEQGGRLVTAVLACRAGSFAMLDPEAQERRLARWGLILSGTAASAVRRIQWVERTVPAQGDEMARFLHADRDPAVPLRGAPMIDSYLELIDSTVKVTHEHEILLAVQVDARRTRDRTEGGVLETLVQETERIAHALEAAEVSVLGALTAPLVARAVRTAFDPYARAELAALETADPDRDGVAEANAWPLATSEEWDHYRSDGALSATYWIGAWPRVDASPMFMDAILGRSSAVRTISVTFEPVPAGRSTREVEAAVTRDRADRELRRRFGQSETARQRQAQEATARREGELAAGHAEVRFAGFVTVTGRDQDDLRRASAQVLEHAARARLELHRMYGQQAEAFTFTLPLCRGLR
jgi:hypothetical protein